MIDERRLWTGKMWNTFQYTLQPNKRKKKKEYKGEYVFRKINNGKIHICRTDQFGKGGGTLKDVKYLCGSIIMFVDEKVNLPFNLISKSRFCKRCYNTAIKSGELSVSAELDKLFDDLIGDL